MNKQYTNNAKLCIKGVEYKECVIILTLLLKKREGNNVSVKETKGLPDEAPLEEHNTKEQSFVPLVAGRHNSLINISDATLSGC